MILYSHSKYKKAPVWKIPLCYIGKAKKKRESYRIDLGKFFSDAFIPALSNNTAVQIYFGGAGSGKSVSIARRTILDMMQGKRNFLIVHKIYGALKDSFYAELKKAAFALGLQKYFKFKLSPLEVTCTLNGTMCIFRGMDDPEKVKSITVPKGIITDIIVEEATILTEPDYDMLETRLRGECEVPKRITILFNPIHNGHWIYKRFFDTANGVFPESARVFTYDIPVKYTDYSTGVPLLVETTRQVYIHKSTYRDNNYLTQEDHILYESWKDINPHKYNVYTLGNWGVLGDLIFPEYHVRDLSKVKFTKVYDGMDFGVSPDPTAYITLAIHNNCIYILNEKSAHKQTYEEIGRMVKPLSEGRTVFADCAEPRTILTLQKHGFKIFPVRKWKDNNKHAIEFFQNYKIVVDYRCKGFISELISYVWEKDKNGDHTGQPADGNDHHIQAAYYALNNLINGYRKGRIGK